VRRRQNSSYRARRLGLRSGQALATDAVGLVGGCAELLVAERLVVGHVAPEEAHLAVAFEGQDVRRDAVQEPAVVADHDDAPGKRLEAGFERAERVDVEIVGRLVEEQDVAARLEQLGQVDAVPLPAGEARTSP